MLNMLQHWLEFGRYIHAHIQDLLNMTEFLTLGKCIRISLPRHDPITPPTPTPQLPISLP